MVAMNKGEQVPPGWIVDAARPADDRSARTSTQAARC